MVYRKYVLSFIVHIHTQSKEQGKHVFSIVQIGLNKETEPASLGHKKSVVR